MKKTRDSIFVFCHDAGGAEIISSYVKRYAASQHFFCMPQGPAMEVFQRKGIQCLRRASNPVKALRAMKGIDMVLVGTSWVNSDWVRIIAAAKRRGIKTAVYLDHWMKDRRRFHNSEYFARHLPDEFWAGDRYAFRLAKTMFPAVVVRLVPNEYFREIKEAFRARRTQYRRMPDKVLFVSSPARVFWKGKKLNFDEFDILESILRRLAAARKKQALLVRFHPFEETNKYDSVLARYAGTVRMSTSSHNDIMDDIVQARVVIGLESMALVLAYLCGKRVISCLPLPRQMATLPFSGIKKVRTLGALRRLL